MYIEKLKSEMEDMAGIEWKKDRRGEKGWPKKDFDKSAIQYHGKTKNYKQEQPEEESEMKETRVVMGVCFGERNEKD